jgi:hypothetical protein
VASLSPALSYQVGKIITSADWDQVNFQGLHGPQSQWSPKCGSQGVPKIFQVILEIKISFPIKLSCYLSLSLCWQLPWWCKDSSGSELLVPSQAKKHYPSTQGSLHLHILATRKKRNKAYFS